MFAVCLNTLESALVSILVLHVPQVTFKLSFFSVIVTDTMTQYVLIHTHIYIYKYICIYIHIYTVELLNFGPPKIRKLLKFGLFGPKIFNLKMIQNAANQRSLAILDQKIAKMYNYEVLLVKYTFDKNLQLNKLNKKQQLFYNYTQFISEICYLEFLT